ncbi:MAG: ABC transporter ATP-binding protein [Micromonosporaceae bacterium]
MTGPMGMAGAGWGFLRSIRNEEAVKDRKLTRHTVRRVIRYARPYRVLVAVFLVAVVISAVAGVATPVLAGRVVNAITDSSDRGLVLSIAFLIAGLAVLDAGFGLLQRLFSARIGEGVILDLRRQVFDHVQRMPLQFFTRTQTGALVSRLNNDVIGAQRAFTTTLSGVVSNVVALALTTGVMFVLSWQITLLSLMLLPLFVLPARWVGRRLAEITRESYQLDAKMNNTMTERFGAGGALLVKLFGRPDQEAHEFAERARRVRDIGVLSALYSSAFFTALTLVASLAQALTYGLGGSLAISGAVSAGSVVTLALLLTRLYGPLTALSNVRVDVMGALVSFDRVFEVLDIRASVVDSDDAVELPAGAARIEFRDVEFGYPAAADVSLASLEDVTVLDRATNDPVLRSVSFTVEPGRMVALVGPSGAGKSTTSMLVPRIYDVTKGAVLVNGVDVRRLRGESLRGAIGVVTQDAHLFHESLRANLAYARPGASDEELWTALERAQLGALIRSLPDGLDTVVGERGYRFSGGEKQRIAIARLLLKEPRIVILDEATAHLDSESEAAVQRALGEALSGRTALVIAHRLSTIRDADEILVLDDGKIVERGRHDELITAGGLYAELYRTQFADSPRGITSPNLMIDPPEADTSVPLSESTAERAGS